MTTSAPVRFAYRYVPNDQLYLLIGNGAIAAAAGAWFWYDLKYVVFALAGLVVAAGLFAAALFLRTLTFVVNDDGLLMVRQRLSRVGGSCSFVARDRIRRIRYRREVYDRDPDDIRKQYLLELITTDSQIRILIVSSEVPIPPRLGKQLADALGTQYEEYLD